MPKVIRKTTEEWILSEDDDSFYFEVIFPNGDSDGFDSETDYEDVKWN